MKTARLKNLIISKLYRPKPKKKTGFNPGDTIGRIDREIDKTVSSLTGLFKS